MIKEEYVSFETAKLLKEAGFPQEGGYDCFFDKEDVRYSIPKQAQAMRWLREEHSISVEPSVTNDEQWCLNVFEFKSVDIIADDEVDRFPTYEAAAEAGIKAACKYLIGNNADPNKKDITP